MVTRAALPWLFLIAAPLGAQSIPQWRFTEELRVGSENDDATGFSDIRGILVEGKGNLWVLEYSTNDIRVFDPSGRHLRTIGRKGQGPGEFVGADGFALAPDGLIWVHDPKNGRFSLFDQDGKFVRQQLAPSLGYGFLWSGGIDRAGRIWDRLFVFDPKNPWDWKVRRGSNDWSRVDTLSMPQCIVPGRSPEEGGFRFPRGTMTVPYAPNPVSAVDYIGAALWCAPTGAEYRILRIDIERGDTLVRITRPVQPIAVTAAEREAAISRVKEFMKRAGEASLDWSRIPKNKPIIQAAFVDDAGRLWVRRSSADIGTSLFDIYSGSGKALASLSVPHPLTPWHRPVTRGAQVWFVAQPEGEVPYVIRGRISPP